MDKRVKIAICMGLFAVLLVSSMAIPKNVAAKEDKYEDNFFTLDMMWEDDFAPMRDTVKKYYEKLGINIKLHDVGSSEEHERYVHPKRGTWEKGTYELMIHDMGGGNCPRNSFGYVSYKNIAPEGWNVYAVQNGTIHDQYMKAIRTLDKEKRADLFEKIAYWRYKNAIGIPIGQDILGPYIHRAEMHNFDPQSSETFEYWEWNMTHETKDHIVAADNDGVDEFNPIIGEPDGCVEPMHVDFVNSYSMKMKGHSFPILLKDWKWVNDTYMRGSLRKWFYWMPKHKWANWSKTRRRVTADDVKFTFNAIQRDNKANLYRGRLAATGYQDTIVKNDSTFYMKFKYPAPNFWLAAGWWGIVPKHVLKDVPDDEWDHHWMMTGLTEEGEHKLPIYSGPYMLTKWVEGETLEYEAWDWCSENLTDGETYPDDFGQGLDSITVKVIPEASTAFAGLLANDIQVTCWEGYSQTQAEKARKSDKLQVVQDLERAGFIAIGTNLANPILSNKWVRKALWWVTPREKLMKIHQVGMVTAQFQPFEENLGYSPRATMPEVNYEKAKDCMEKAGYKYKWIEKERGLPLWVWIVPVATFLIGFVPTVFYFKRKKELG